MSDQDLEMQFADPDWQPSSSVAIRPVRKNASSEIGQSTQIRRHQPALKHLESRKQRQLLVLVARVALGVIWFTTPLVTRAFHGGWLVPLLGILFLPLTTLTYTIVFTVASGVTGLGWLWIVGALLLDLMSYGGQTSKRKSDSAQDEK